MHITPQTLAGPVPAELGIPLGAGLPFIARAVSKRISPQKDWMKSLQRSDGAGV